jgi:4-carboxymuconolactone decarboxylase
MTPSETALIRLCAAIATGSRSQVAETIDAAITACDPVEAEEAILQCYLFTGFPAVIQAMTEWRRRSGPRSERGASDNDGDAFDRRGERVCATVYGGQYDRLRENVRALHPDLERWMLSEGYGKVLGRSGLPLRVRELCIIAVLSAQDAPRQLYSHLRGALNAGAQPAEVEAALAAAASIIPAARSEAARRTWHEVQQRRSL